MVIGDLYAQWERKEIQWMLNEIRQEKLYYDFETQLNCEEIEQLEAWINKRKVGYPLQYLFGHWDFYSMDLLVDERALIPRPETELFVDHLLERIEPESKVLEIGVGTGAIILALDNYGDFQCTGVDISSDAIALAKENNAKLHCNVEMILSDLFQELKGRTFDFIVSNPPYIDKEDISDLQKELSYEPINALYGGTDGLDFYRRIIGKAPKYLTKNGQLAFEIGYNQFLSVKNLLDENGFVDIICYKDYGNLDRMVFAKLGEKRD